MACRHHELCERACERDLTQIEEELQEEIEVVLARFFAESAIRPDHQSDPRGRTLMLYLPNGRYNSWDGESWRIPTPS